MGKGVIHRVAGHHVVYSSQKIIAIIIEKGEYGRATVSRSNTLQPAIGAPREYYALPCAAIGDTIQGIFDSAAGQQGKFPGIKVTLCESD